MITLRNLVPLVALAASIPAFAQTASGAANASWNSGRNDKGNVAFWIRDKEGSCDEQKTALPLVFAPRNVKAGASSGALQVKDLSYCFLYLKDAQDPKDLESATTSCTSGSVEFTYHAAANEYRGKYDFTMKNKMVRRGAFRAQLCKPNEPVKK